MYADTEEALGAIADDMGLGDRVRSWFRNPGYTRPLQELIQALDIA
jgi:hypothetical protein